jgi:hypothetical protein
MATRAAERRERHAAIRQRQEERAARAESDRLQREEEAAQREADGVAEERRFVASTPRLDSRVARRRRRRCVSARTTLIAPLPRARGSPLLPANRRRATRRRQLELRRKKGAVAEMHAMRACMTYAGWLPWRKLMQLRDFRWTKAEKHATYALAERVFRAWSGLIVAQKRAQLSHDLRRQALATGWYHVHLSRRVLGAWRTRCVHTHEAAVAVAAARTLGCARQFWTYWRHRAMRRRTRRGDSAGRLGARCVPPPPSPPARARARPPSRFHAEVLPSPRWPRHSLRPAPSLIALTLRARRRSALARRVCKRWRQNIVDRRAELRVHEESTKLMSAAQNYLSDIRAARVMSRAGDGDLSFSGDGGGARSPPRSSRDGAW